MRNEHDKSKMHKATVVAPVVRLVTPTLRNTKSIAAFEDELLIYFGWQNVADFDYDVYSARNNNGRLKAQAKNAFDDSPTVIVTCGSQATLFAMGFTTTIPIIQAAGGQAPSAPNVTGFTINAESTALDHLNTMTATAITVLYDDTNPPSVAVFNKLNANVPMGKTLKPLKISDPKKFGPQPAMDGFMVIPNAMYYSHSAAIAAMVDGNANEIYYPEREYKNAHRKKNNVSVHGHHIQNTFRQAAGYVNRILLGATIAQLPSFDNAVNDGD
ncbi:MAG: hypothetical protein WCD67_23080 [Xanthobacteraceae bacterium]